MYEIIDNSDEETSAKSYDQNVGAEAMIRNRYYDKITGVGNYNAMHENSLYEVKFPDLTTEQLVDNIIAENILSQVDHECNIYKVLTEVADNKNYDCDIAKLDGFIKSSSGNLQWNRKTRGWKLLVE